MPDFATIYGQFECPFCHHAYNALQVHWGGVPDTYRIGDEVRWLTRDGAFVKPWTLRLSENRWNAGDPHIRHVIVRDTGAWDLENRPHCGYCKNELGGAVVEVLEGRFVSGKILKPREHPDAQYLVDGTRPMKEWEDRGLDIDPG
jgi:hypothetical protein